MSLRRAGHQHSMSVIVLFVVLAFGAACQAAHAAPDAAHHVEPAQAAAVQHHDAGWAPGEPLDLHCGLHAIMPISTGAAPSFGDPILAPKATILSTPVTVPAALPPPK